MREVKFTDLITLAMERTGTVLFKPFSLKKWMKLILIAFLAGAFSGGGLSGSGGGHDDKKADASPVAQQHMAADAGVSESPASTDTALKTKDRIEKFFEEKTAQFLSLSPAVMITVVFCAVAGTIALMVFFLWIGSRFKFVWFDAMTRNRDAIREPFRLYKEEGNSLFRLLLALGLGFLALICVLGAAVCYTLVSVDFFKAGWANAGGAVTALAFMLVVFIGATVLLCLWSFCIESFVVTIMAIDRGAYGPAWQKFWQIYKKNIKDFWLFFLIMIGLGIVGSIAEGIAAVIVFLVFLLVGALVFGLGYLSFVAFLKIEMLFWTFAVVLGIPFVITLVIVLVSIGLPLAVFFRSLSLYFFSSLNCGYVPLALSNPKESV